MNANNSIAIFESKKIRRIWHEEDWWFSVVDVVGALTDSLDPKDYWYKMKIRVRMDDGFELSTICRQLKQIAEDGKLRETDYATNHKIYILQWTTTLERIINY